MTVCAHALKRGDRTNPTTSNSNMLLSKRIKASCTSSSESYFLFCGLDVPGVLRCWFEAEQLVPQRKFRDE